MIAEAGNHTATILEDKVEHPEAMQTDIHRSQLHIIPRRNNVLKGKDVFAMAVATAAGPTKKKEKRQMKKNQ